MNIIEIKSDIPYGSNSYLIESGESLMLIDPSTDPKKIIPKLRINPKNIKYIILTHAHFDHILYLNEWVEISGVLPTVSIDEASALADSKLNCYSLFFGLNKGYFGNFHTVSDGDEITIGDDNFTVIHTPGHTKGSICLLGDEVLFSGDTVFESGAVGRCDLPGGDLQMLNLSIKKLCKLPENITVYPGHNGKTNIKEIKLYHR